MVGQSYQVNFQLSEIMGNIIELFHVLPFFRLPSRPPTKMLAFTEESFLSRKKKERPGRGETFIDSGDD